MPRLDATRVRAWRDLQSIVPEIERRIDEDLRAEWAVPLGWFDVLAALRELDGRARPQDVATVMRIPASSLSRRLDRLEEEGWVRRHRDVDPDDHRAVEVELTRRGRALWREMNVSYRRSVQARFAIVLTDRDIQSLAATTAHLGRSHAISDHTRRCLTPTADTRSPAEPDTSVSVVHRLDLLGVPRMDAAPLQLRRRGQHVAVGQPLLAEHREALDLLDLRELLR